ncbi:MAG TPA: fatty acid desaturase [Verrucomicrobiae bacterium]|nr:fatty acid desaturase [Verrucomicrobiae bacterium]
MKAGKELVRSTKAYAMEDTARSWWYVLSTGFLLLAAIGGTLWNFHLAGKLVCSGLAGLLILRFFVIYHDQQHHAILAHSRPGEVIMRIFGILALSPSSIWRSSHNHHHNHNSKLRGSHIGSFPIMTKEQYGRSSRGKRFKYLFMRHPFTILFGYVFIFLFGMCVYPFFNSPRRHLDSLIAFVVHVLIAVALIVYLGWQAWLVAQVGPHFVASAVGSYLFYAQHNFPEASFRDNAGWTYESAALESSSFMKMNPLMAWFTANIGYHHVHHLNARIPFYRLPEVVKAVPELQRPRTTSLSPRDIFRCLQLKVYDVERQRLVGLHST